MPINSTKEFILSDYNKTLFPLETNRILVDSFSNEISAYIYEKVLRADNEECSFLPQTRAYASKPGYHLRRTFKLDPVAEYFIYDVVYRNRSKFRRDFKQTRRNYGYRIIDGEPIPATNAYHEFKKDIRKCSSEYKYCLKFDVSSYFNSIYHHDLVNWLGSIDVNENDLSSLDKFFKQINAGRSIDCLPQSLYSSKMIGSHYLKFIDNSPRILSEEIVRFMDDFVLFSDSEKCISSDFQNIQIILGEKGLSVNSGKTKMGEIEALNLEKEIDNIKRNLLQKRYEFIENGSGAEFEEVTEERSLSKEEEDYLLQLLNVKNIEEEDAELILRLMRDSTEKVIEHLETFIIRFPNLSKSIYYYCENILDKSGLASLLLRILKGDYNLSEYQLFWIAKIAERYLSQSDIYGELLIKCLDHENSTEISKAKILEINDKRFGLTDIRESNLRTGGSSWVSWASAIGMLSEKKSSRNHIISYFANGSPLNRLISECVQKIGS